MRRPTGSPAERATGLPRPRGLGRLRRRGRAGWHARQQCNAQWGRRVEGIVVLAESAEMTTAAPRKPGFPVTGESNATRPPTGSVDTRELAEPTQRAVGVRVEPLVEPGTP